LNKSVKATHKLRRRTRLRRKQRIFVDNTYTDDELSIENYGALTTSHSSGLQERAHQAWKSRQRKNSSLRSKHDCNLRCDNRSNVSFGASDTIHRFEPDAFNKKQYEIEDEEDISFDRSLNSEYTKTLESEVEDMIKDILFIGSPETSKPGRRKYRYKPEVKRKLWKERIASTITDTGTKDRLGVLHESNIESVEDGPSSSITSTFEERNQEYDSTKEPRFSTKEKKHCSRSKSRTQTFGDERFSLASTISRASSVDSNTVETFQTEKDNIEDPFSSMMGLVEGGLSVVTSAIGYALGDYSISENQGDSIDYDKKAANDYDFLESCGIHLGDPKQDGWVLGHAGNVDLIGSEKIVLRSKKAAENSESHSDEDPDSTLTKDDGNESRHRTLTPENASELIRLAVYAARSVHKLQGVEYDESVAIDMFTEIKKCHVTLELPLGIIFLENDAGCFVTKVSPDGSAARSRRVEVGDQLASINGTSSINMKVDDICDSISISSDPSRIELVFLRYIGPFRPSTKNLISQEKADKTNIKSSLNDRVSNSLHSKKTTKKKTGFRLFGKGKKKNIQSNEHDNIGNHL